MKKLKIFFANSNPELRNYFKKLKAFKRLDSWEDADIIIYGGGADVSPDFYGEKIGNRTTSYPMMDLQHRELFKLAFPRGKRFIGICRGAQFLCVMAGGKLIQDVSNHAIYNTHNAVMKTGHGEIIDIRVNSTHHQMLMPYNLPNWKYDIIAYSEGISSYYLNGYNTNYPFTYEMHPDSKQDILPFNNLSKFKEPEIVHFPKIDALAIQSHPEYRSMPKKSLELINKLILDFAYEKREFGIPF